MVYLDIDLVLPSCICVLRKTLICGLADHVKSPSNDRPPPLRPRKPTETLPNTSDISVDISSVAIYLFVALLDTVVFIRSMRSVPTLTGLRW